MGGSRLPQRKSIVRCFAKAWYRPFYWHAHDLWWRDRMAIHIRRREFIFTLGGAAVAWPLAARAQRPKVPTIGALVIGNISPEEFWREFRQGLRDLGYIEGQNI